MLYVRIMSVHTHFVSAGIIIFQNFICIAHVFSKHFFFFHLCMVAYGMYMCREAHGKICYLYRTLRSDKRFGHMYRARYVVVPPK